jgi:hypothetical protein
VNSTTQEAATRLQGEEVTCYSGCAIAGVRRVIADWARVR